MKVWMTPQTKKKNGFTKKIFCNALKIVVPTMVLFLCLIFLIFNIIKYVPQYKEVLIFLSWLFIVFLICFLAWKIVFRVGKDAVIFCRDEEGHLYIIEAYNFVRQFRGITRTLEIQRKLNEIKQRLEEDVLPPEAIEILKVNVMKKRSGYCSLVCQVRFRNGNTGKRTYILVNGYENEGELLYILEKMRSAENLIEIKASKYRNYVLLSSLVLAILVVLCFCSHPYIGILPQAIYFPSLGLAFLTLLFVVYFISKYRHGE